MLSDEKKKAIGYFRNKIGDFELLYGKKITTQENEYLKTLLNLIEKQSKEIEHLKRPKYIIDVKTNEVITLTNNFISKDKIKAKIEIMNTNIVNAEKFDCDYIGQCRFAKYVLQSLIEKE